MIFLTCALEPGNRSQAHGSNSMETGHSFEPPQEVGKTSSVPVYDTDHGFVPTYGGQNKPWREQDTALSLPKRWAKQALYQHSNTNHGFTSRGMMIV